MGERIEDIGGGTLSLGALAVDDLFVVLDVSDTTDDADGTTKNIEWQSMLGTALVFAGAGGLTATNANLTLATTSSGSVLLNPAGGVVRANNADVRVDNDRYFSVRNNADSGDALSVGANASDHAYFVTWSASKPIILAPANSERLRVDDDGAEVTGALRIAGADNGLQVGDDAQAYAMSSFRGSFTPSGGTGAFGLTINPDITGANGQTFGHFLTAIAGNGFGGSITTQGNSDTIARVGTLYLDEPAISVGAGDAITMASTLWIAGAPSEATMNYAIYVADGDLKLDNGDVHCDGNLAAGGNHSGTSRLWVKGGRAQVDNNHAWMCLAVGGSTGAEFYCDTSDDCVISADLGIVLVEKTIMFPDVRYVPSGTTETIDLADGNHQVLDLSNTTGNPTITFDVGNLKADSNAAGQLKVLNDGTSRELTFAITGGTSPTLSKVDEPVWSTDWTANQKIVIAWNWDADDEELAVFFTSPWS